jgi:hypothetical protein
MVKSIADFAQINMEQFSGYSTVWMKPVFCVAPEPFDPIDMVSSFRLSLLFANHDMFTANRKRSVRLPIIGVIQTPRFRMSLHQIDDRFLFSFLQGKNLYFPIPSKDTEYNHFSGSAPTTFPRACAANHRFIAFYRSFKGLSASFLIRATRAYQTEKSFNCLRRCYLSKSKPISGNTIDKQLYQFQFGLLG